MESEKNRKKSTSSNSFASTFVSAKKKCIKFCSNKNPQKDGYERLQSPSPPKYYDKSTQTTPEKRIKQKDLIEF